MDEKNIDQTLLYREYFDRIVVMNQQNTDYLSAVGDISTQRRDALQKAIELHIKPIVTRLENIRIILWGIAAIALIVTLYSCSSSLSNLSQETSWSGVWAATSGLVTVIAFGILAVCAVVLTYVGRKIADLNSRAKAALEAKIEPLS